MVPTRRAALRLAGGVFTTGVAGCISSVTDDSDSPSPPPSTDTRNVDDLLAFSAEAIAQSSAGAPARIEARVRNVGDEAIELGFGPALLFTDDADDALQWPDELLLDPDSSGVVNPDPETGENGCWRFPEDGWQDVRSVLRFREIDPGSAVEETYAVYTWGKSLPCLPAGTYTFQDRAYLESESRPLRLTLEVTINERSRLSARGRLEMDEAAT